MNKCPSCKEEIVEGSAICPNCGYVIDKTSQFADVDNELERFSQMIFDMENNVEPAPQYSIGDLDKILNGDGDDVVSDQTDDESSLDGEITNETPDVTESEEEKEPVVEVSAPIVFTASSKGVKKVETTQKTLEVTSDEMDKALNLDLDETEESDADESNENTSDSLETENGDDSQTEDIEEVAVDVPEEESELSKFLDDTVQTEADLDKIFDEIAQYEEEINDISSDVSNLKNNKTTEEPPLDSEDVEDITRMSTPVNSMPIEEFIDPSIDSASILSNVMTLESMLKKPEDSENIDAHVEKFLEEIKNDNFETAFSGSLGETYLKLNFVTTEKFATLISSENERIDNVSVNLTNENDSLGKFTDILNIEAIIDAEQLSDDELEKTIEAVSVQKTELISSLEQEEKEIIINKYKTIKRRTFSYLKVGVFVSIIILSLYLASYIFDIRYFKVQSELYNSESVEAYDNYIYGSVLEIKNITETVNENFKQYKAGNLSDAEMVKVCDESTKTLNKYKVLFDKQVYEEAEEYVFQASNAFFFASYYIENISQYVQTKDNYFLRLNEIADKQSETIIAEVNDARVGFLKNLGYTDEEIGIFNYKAHNEQ